MYTKYLIAQTEIDWVGKAFILNMIEEEKGKRMVVLEEPMKEVLTLKNYINGEWVESRGSTINVVNPATCKVIAKVPLSTKDEIDSALEAAKRVFPEWRRTPPLARARCLFRLKELMEEHFEELSRIQTFEHGKTIDESRGETRRGIENVEVPAGVPSLMMGYNLEDISAGIDEYLVRQPLGVFGIIPSFNFPFMVPLWYAPYAVSTGNCVIVKPSPHVPISQTRLAELVNEAGFPPGVWNIVQGGEEIATHMLDHPDIKGICFVGSTAVGKNVYKKCGETGKRVIAQCSAKNFLLVMPDADLGKTIAACMTSFFGNTGQRCLSGANLAIVGDGLNDRDYDSFYKKVVDAFIDAASNIRVGYGLDESVQMGPLQNSDRKERVLGLIQKGLDEGARLGLDGRNVKLCGDWPEKCFLNPTVFEEVTPDMTIGREEIFGPVASIIKARGFDEILEMISNNHYGNAASIFTSSGKWAREFQYRVECGNIGINVGIAAPMAFFPFSGMKDSFFGTLHGQGVEAVRFFTESKVIIQRWF
ncbi:MAG: malonate-semialdehyde dehydrogenase (acetylating) / methylmalonate-semialdehyde dehydrogenase [Thermoproteota archaeon]|nr:malonate-semialdehyde dehydrogenase (acetylating) / methylmalonate-semialdehyde dehydrogenase [Thermoproteota archaeon]